MRRLKGTASEYRRQDRWDTIPNVITGAGMIGVVCYVYLFLTGGATWLILTVCVGVVLSDALDGVAADEFGQHSSLGALLDPLRDRMFAVAMFANFAHVSADKAVLVALWVAVVAEAWIVLLFLRGLFGEVHMFGKIRTLIHFVCSFIAMVELYWFEDVAYLSALAGIMAAASVGATAFYTHRAYSNAGNNKET